MPQPRLTFACELDASRLGELVADAAVIEDLRALEARVAIMLSDLSSERADAVSLGHGEDDHHDEREAPTEPSNAGFRNSAAPPQAEQSEDQADTQESDDRLQAGELRSTMREQQVLGSVPG